MNKTELDKMTVEQLLKHFIELCVEQYEASELGQAARYNRSFRKMRSVENELKIRPGDARSALIPFYDHSNPQVQLMAAEATVAIAPEAARDALRAIKLRRWNPYQAMNAGMCLRTLDEGTFKPT